MRFQLDEAIDHLSRTPTIVRATMIDVPEQWVLTRLTLALKATERLTSSTSASTGSTSTEYAHGSGTTAD